MTLQELRDEVRSLICEKTAGQWEDAELNRWLNQGTTDFARKTYVLVNTDPITLVAVQSAYDFPSNVVDVLGIVVDNYPLEFVPEKVLDNDKPTWRDDAGTPKRYFLRGEKIVFDPTPEAADVAKTCTATSAKIPTEMSANDNECGLPSVYHSIIPLYAAQVAMMKDREFDEADKFRARYDAEVARAAQIGFGRIYKGTSLIMGKGK